MRTGTELIEIQGDAVEGTPRNAEFAVQLDLNRRTEDEPCQFGDAVTKRRDVSAYRCCAMRCECVE